MTTETTDRTIKAAGSGPGERHLNGVQTTGRDYRNLSEPTLTMIRDENVAVPLRDGTTLLADVYRPAEAGTYPVLVSASCYPRQIQDIGAPMGFIEAGASDFFVPRGYVHVIVNLRGTSGSEGTFTLFDAQERDDLYDIVEWAGSQPFSDGAVGMIGISYFAMTQIEAAVMNPPHLKAIFPFGLTEDLYALSWHGGLYSADFITNWLQITGMMAGEPDELWRGRLMSAVRAVLRNPRLHEKMQHVNGESTLAVVKKLVKPHFEEHPWVDLLRAMIVEHPTRDAFWDERNLRPLLENVTVPVYLGADWTNQAVHLPSTFTTWEGLKDNPNVRMGMLPAGGLSWPWETLHTEALAWFDHWLKDRDTGIMDGDPIRYWVPGADEWRTSTVWPPAGSLTDYALAADGSLSPADAEEGLRSYLDLAPTSGWPQTASADPRLPDRLTWETAALDDDLDVVGDAELVLDAHITGADTAWIAGLYDVEPDGAADIVTIGWLRAALAEVDETASRPGAPVIECRHPRTVAGNGIYRVPLVATAHRFLAGHRLRLTLVSDDTLPDAPTVMDFTHARPGGSSVNTISAASRLRLPVASSAE